MVLNKLTCAMVDLIRMHYTTKLSKYIGTEDQCLNKNVMHDNHLLTAVILNTYSNMHTSRVTSVQIKLGKILNTRT